MTKLTVFPSAGHSNSDPGATANDFKESSLTQELRNLVVERLKVAGHRYITDKDSETNRQYQGRIKPGNGSVLLDFHFNAGPPSATGTEVIVSNVANDNSRLFARELVDGASRILGIRNRGVKGETGSQHSRIGILHTEAGIAALAEVCFITNEQDVAAYQVNKERLADFYAKTLIKYDNVI
jgi:N-acetylmuramoyl-L-alanine amidase